MSETTQTGREPQVFRVALLPRLLFAAVYGALFMIVVGCVSIAHMGSVLDIYTFELFADLVIGSVVAFILAAAAGISWIPSGQSASLRMVLSAAMLGAGCVLVAGSRFRMLVFSIEAD